MRVSTHFQNQSLLTQIQRAQAEQDDAQRQVSSGKKTDSYAGLGRDAATVLGAHTLVQRAEAYGDVVTVLDSRLTMQDSNLGAIGDSVNTLISTLRSAVNSGNAGGVMDAVNATFSTTAQGLNASFGGQYMFGGTRTDAQPFAATSLQDLADPAKTVADFFNDTGALQSVTVADGMVIQPGIRASDAGQTVMATLKALVEFDAASGPLGAVLTDTQRDFLNQQVEALSGAARDITDLRALNGGRQKQIETLQAQHKDTADNARGLLDDLENADLATAITRLNEDQIRLQALYKMVDQLNQLSLLEFI